IAARFVKNSSAVRPFQAIPERYSQQSVGLLDLTVRSKGSYGARTAVSNRQIGLAKRFDRADSGGHAEVRSAKSRVCCGFKTNLCGYPPGRRQPLRIERTARPEKAIGSGRLDQMQYFEGLYIANVSMGSQLVGQTRAHVTVADNIGRLTAA